MPKNLSKISQSLEVFTKYKFIIIHLFVTSISGYH